MALTLFLFEDSGAKAPKNPVDNGILRFEENSNKLNIPPAETPCRRHIGRVGGIKSMKHAVFLLCFRFRGKHDFPKNHSKAQIFEVISTLW